MTIKRFVHTPFDKSKLQHWDIRHSITDDVLEVIDRPHAHEGEGNPPIWIIWALRKDCAPQVDTLCDTADSAVYHYAMIAQEIEQAKRVGGNDRTATVERVPANHRFASSVAYLFAGPIAYGRPFQRRDQPRPNRKPPKREGD